MKIINTPREFGNEINGLLLNFLKEDFKDYVFETEKKMIDKVVYSYQATPAAMRKRRKDNEGLSDIRNMEAIQIQAAPGEDAVVYVNNTLPQEQEYVAHDLSEAEAVETGNADWRMNNDEQCNGPGPRMFMDATYNHIIGSSETYRIFQGYFNKYGIKTIKIK